MFVLFSINDIIDSFQKFLNIILDNVFSLVDFLLTIFDTFCFTILDLFPNLPNFLQYGLKNLVILIIVIILLKFISLLKA